jgi:hypothetical protein
VRVAPSACAEPQSAKKKLRRTYVRPYHSSKDQSAAVMPFRSSDQIWKLRLRLTTPVITRHKCDAKRHLFR